MGRFDQLEQYIGIDFCTSDKQAAVSLFDWIVEETIQLHKLKGAGTNIPLINKHYRHICYLYETKYALYIDQNKNISVNPGCECQLGYYRIELIVAKQTLSRKLILIKSIIPNKIYNYHLYYRY